MNSFAAPVLNGLSGLGQWFTPRPGVEPRRYDLPYNGSLLALEQKLEVINIDNDLDWYLMGIVLTTATSNSFQIRISRAGVYYFSSGWIHALNLVSDAASPAPFIPPQKFERGSKLNLDIKDLSAAPNTIQLVFLGLKG
jgi:hypothetical protein